MHLTYLALAGLVGLAPSVLGQKLLAAHYTGKIFTLTYTPGSGNAGTLSVGPSASGCGNMPAWLTLDSASGTLYCFDESSGMFGGGGVVASFSVANDGTLKQTGQAKTTGGDVHGWLYGGSDGKGFLSMAEYDPSTISTYKLPLSSSSQVLQKEKFTMSQAGPNKSRQNAPHPHSTITDPTGKYLLVPDLGADLIRIFRIDATSGKLTACTPGQAGAGDGPRHGVFWQPPQGSNSTAGTTMYTVNELSNSVSAWKVTYPASEGSGCLSLSKTQTLSTYAEGKTAPARSKAAEVHVAGNHLYAANRNDQTFGSQQDSLVRYDIDAATGAISWGEASNAHAWYVRTFAINKAGTLVAVGGQTSSNVAIIQRDPATGKLGALLANTKVATPGNDGAEDGLSTVIWDE